MSGSSTNSAVTASMWATESLQSAYDFFHLDAFDSNAVLTGYLDEVWDSKSYNPEAASSTLAFTSDKGSKLTNKFSVADTSSSETNDLKAANGGTLKTSHSESYKETASSFTDTLKDSVTYKEGASTKDKADDIALTTSFSSKYSETSSSSTSTNSGSVSYTDGHGTKFTFKSSEKVVDSTDTVTVSDMSYSDASGHIFKFSGTISDDGNSTILKIKSLSITTGGETLKLGASTVTDSQYDYWDLFAVGTSDGGLSVDFNGATDDGVGMVSGFFDTYATAWTNLYHTVHG